MNKELTKEILEKTKNLKYINPLRLSKTTEVISCDRCSGTGIFSKEECTDYHKREYDIIYSKCTKCDGDGRLTKTVFSVSFNTTDYTDIVPYSQNPIERPKTENDYLSLHQTIENFKNEL